MSGGKFLLDTNTVLYLLGGKLKPADIPSGLYYISFITELELFSYPGLSNSESAVITDFLNSTEIIDITADIKNKTIVIRKKHKIKLPDAIICATAQSMGARLISKDKRLKSIDTVMII
jgi:predicted nucleic acid-binding protein